MSYVRHYAPDNASLVIRLALEQVGAPYRCALVDRRQAAQRSNAYMALKPNGLIPTLETDQGPIFETGAILLWLANRHGGVGPAPDSAERADFLTWLFFLSNTVHSALLMLFYPEQFIGADPIHQSTLRANAANALVRYHTQLNGLVAHGHTWCGEQKPRALDFSSRPHCTGPPFAHEIMTVVGTAWPTAQPSMTCVSAWKHSRPFIH